MMYELLAHVYDALVKDDEATACWVELIKAHIRGTELLELACGSGKLQSLLHRRATTLMRVIFPLP